MEQCSSSSWGESTAPQQQSCEARKIEELQQPVQVQRLYYVENMFGRSVPANAKRHVTYCVRDIKAHDKHSNRPGKQHHVPLGPQGMINGQPLSSYQTTQYGQMLQVHNHKYLLAFHHQHHHHYHLPHPMGRTCRPCCLHKAVVVGCHRRHCQLDAPWPLRHSQPSASNKTHISTSKS